MLMKEVLLRLREPESWKPGIEVRLVVAATEEAVGLVDQRDFHVCYLCCSGVDFLHEAPEMPGGRVVLIAGDLGDNLGDDTSHDGGYVVCSCSEVRIVFWLSRSKGALLPLRTISLLKFPCILIEVF